MKYLKLIQQTVFVLLILLDMDLSGQIAISCNGDIIPVNRILQDDINLNGINFEAYAESDKVRNACGGANGIHLVFSTRFNGTSNPINATIYLTSNEINYQFVSHSGLQNVQTSNGEFQGDFVFSNQEDGCAEILLAIPEVNYYGDEQFKKFITQNLNITVQNHTLSATFSKSFQLYNDQIFENYYHFYDNTTASVYLNSFNNGLFIDAPTLHYFHKNFTIDENFDFFNGFNTGDPEFTQYFDVNSKIAVQGGSLLDITGNHLTACPSNVWEGIEVLAGGELKFEKSWGSEAKTFITCNSNSNISVFDSRIFNSDKGLLIKGNTQLSNFTNNKLEDLNTGIFLSENATNIKITPLDITKPNIFNNISQAGIYSSSSINCEVMFNKFENIASGSPQGSSNAAIRSENSSILIVKNEIKNCSKGTHSLADKIYVVSDNEYLNNTLGARVRNNNAYCSILSNTITGKNGINYSFASPLIENNYINNDGNFPTESFGIQGNYSSSATIKDNNSFSSDATGAVVLNNSTAAVVSNDISLLSQNTITGVSLNGGDGTRVSGNTIEAADSPGTESFGVVSSASAASEVSCNDIFQLEEALVAKDNSMDIDLKTNNLFSLGTGIKLEHSIIGEQVHNGNLFVGPFSTADIYAIEMATYEVDGSKFIVDGAENPLFVPHIVASNGDLVDDENTALATELCSSAIYTNILKNRLHLLCITITNIKNNASLDPLRKKHILLFYYNLIKKYYKDKSQWPDCIRLFMNEFNGTNIEKMVNLNEKMSLLLKPVNCDITLQNNFDTYLSAYLVEFHDGVRNDQSRTNFQQASMALLNAIPDRDIAFFEFLDEMTNDLESFIPEDEYDATWLDLQTLWLKSWKNEDLTEAEKFRIETIANLCPLQYGDLVHGARALAGEWSDTRFDLLSCNTDSETRASKTVESNQGVVYPNPTSSKIHFNTRENIVKITIYDVNNILVLQTQVVSGEAIDVSTFPAGLYLITLEELNGEIKTDKFIKME